MCRSLLTEGNPDYAFGDIFELCDPVLAITHLPLKALGISKRYLSDEIGSAAIKGVIGAFAQQAKYLVIEYNYFDIDYRSEYSRTHESSFKVRSPAVLRLHFFAAGSKPPDSYRLSDFVFNQQIQYLGYWIFRPQIPGFVGRSVVTTNVTDPQLSAGMSFSHHVRTAVREYVQLFGVGLHADGVVFMEQDGHLLRCAHVSSWICHYSAVLRGLVNRHTTADFHGADDDGYAPYGRLYPSPGLSVNVLSASLRRVGLPPEVADLSTLRESRDRQWYDSSSQWPTDESDNALIFWIRKNLTETLCRYLNSGVPCILSREAISHTQVVIGYLRSEDLNSGVMQTEGVGASNTDTRRGPHSDVTHLIVSDDQIGPFVIVDLEAIVDEVATRGTTAVVVPLPRALLLTGGVAEGYAGLLFARYAAANVDILNETADDESPECLIAARNFAEGTTETGTLAIRTYATTGADFKESWVERLAGDTENEEVMRLISHLPLPKYVWVSEATDRVERGKGKSEVVRATIVFDAFEVALDADSQSQILPLFIHVPGRAYVPLAAELFEPDTEIQDDQDGGLSSDDEGEDDAGDVLHFNKPVRTGCKPYRSGRHKSGTDRYFSAERYAERAKGATARL